MAACAEGRFSIYPVQVVDEAIELLTGVPAGTADAEGLVPEGTINYRVATELAGLSSLRQAFTASSRPSGETVDGGVEDSKVD